MHGNSDDVPEYFGDRDVNYDGIFRKMNSNQITITVEDFRPERRTKKMKEIRGMILRNQREYDLQQLYGYDSTTESEGRDQTDALNGSESLFYSVDGDTSAPSFRSTNGNIVEHNPDEDKRLAEIRKKRIIEIFDTILWLLILVVRQSTIIFEKVFKYFSNHHVS